MFAPEQFPVGSAHSVGEGVWSPTQESSSCGIHSRNTGSLFLPTPWPTFLIILLVVGEHQVFPKCSGECQILRLGFIVPDRDTERALKRKGYVSALRTTEFWQNKEWPKHSFSQYWNWTYLWKNQNSSNTLTFLKVSHPSSESAQSCTACKIGHYQDSMSASLIPKGTTYHKWLGSQAERWVDIHTDWRYIDRCHRLDLIYILS